METKQLDCGCIMQKPIKNWYAISLCDEHATDYFTNTRPTLRKLRKMCQ